MGIGKVVAIGAGAVFVFISAMNAIGQNLAHEFGQQAVADGDPTLAIASAAPVLTISATTDAKVAKPSRAENPKSVKLGDMDEADRAIRLAINVSGHLCARPIEVREAGTGLYGVQCITNRNGTGISNYLVNSMTNEVTEI